MAAHPHSLGLAHGKGGPLWKKDEVRGGQQRIASDHGLALILGNGGVVSASPYCACTEIGVADKESLQNDGLKDSWGRFLSSLRATC